MDYPFKKVCVIDDSEIDRYIIASVIKRYCFANEVIDFNMAQKALTWLEQNQNNTTVLPEIILLDINMPEMNGFDFLENYKSFPESLLNQINVVILTSSNNPDDSASAAKNPLVRAFINKPLNEAKLIKIVGALKKSSEKAA
jgi:CheY-like chemotaxis protein